MPHTRDSDEQSRGDGDAPGLLAPVTVERKIMGTGVRQPRIKNLETHFSLPHFSELL